MAQASIKKEISLNMKKQRDSGEAYLGAVVEDPSKTENFTFMVSSLALLTLHRAKGSYRRKIS